MLNLTFQVLALLYQKITLNSVGARYEFLVGDCKENKMDSIAKVLLAEFKKRDLCTDALIIIDFEGGKQVSFSNCSLLDN